MANTQSAVEQRHWGFFENVFEIQIAPGLFQKVKKLYILPGKNISQQFHNCRDEYWSIEYGTGQLLLGEDVIDIKQGDKFFIPKGTIHSIKADPQTYINVLEVQVGSQVEESDVTRLSLEFPIK